MKRKLCLSLAALLLAAAIPSPARPAVPAATPIVDLESPAPAVLGPQAALAACTLEPGAITAQSLAWTLPDAWTAVAWRVPLQGCTACPAPQALELKTVSFRVRWFEACSAQAEISVIGAVNTGACVVPDPAQVLCPPTTYTITSPGLGGVVYTLPLPAGCCVSGDAFVLVRFPDLVGCGTSAFSPALTVASAPCAPCQQYFSTVASPALTDWCTSPGALNLLWISIAADCCQPTPAGGRSWGEVKAIYR